MKNILIITLTNVGDVALTLPLINSIIQAFPDWKVSIMVGHKAKNLFERDPRICRLIEYDKSLTFRKKLNLVCSLMKAHYNIVVDLRNSFIPLLLGKWRFNNFRKPPQCITHMRDRHMWRGLSYGIQDTKLTVTPIYIPEEDKSYINTMLKGWGIKDGDRVAVVAHGAKSSTKQWTIDGFAELCDRLIAELDVRIVIIGDSQDKDFAHGIICKMSSHPFNAVGLTSLRQLAYMIKCARLLISNDSAPVHIAGCIGTPSVVLFGPTDPKKYGPVGRDDMVIRKEGFKCMPCEEALCRLSPEYPARAICMESITADEVFDAVRMLLLKRRQE